MTLPTKGPSCIYCEDWGCRRCLPAHEVAAAAGGEQGPTDEELRDALVGLRHELPPVLVVPRGERGMPRYGIQWNGLGAPLPVSRPDGYWTPWHLANAALAALTAEVDGVTAVQQVQEERARELIAEAEGDLLHVEAELARLAKERDEALERAAKAEREVAAHRDSGLASVAAVARIAHDVSELFQELAHHQARAAKAEGLLREHLAASWAAPVAWRDRVRAALAGTTTILRTEVPRG